MKKIVDVVAVVKDKKSNEYKSARPIRDGKVERWWYEGGDTPHSINKRTANRNLSGRQKLGEDLPSVEETLTRFKFKGFEFGNWLSQAERYDVFRAFQFCLADMIKWLGTNNFGVDNQIGVAFGARGSGKALAHYEPTTNIINMTKKKGAGSLLHEYAHALDYTIGAFIDQCARYTSLSGGREKEQKSDNVGCQFRAMMNKILNYVRSTESFTKLKKITHNSDYWCNSTELFARLTESYYAYYHNDSHNYYLVKPTSFYERSYGIYLSKKEMDVIKPELDKFWKEVGLLLNDKCKLKATPYPKNTTVKKEAKTNSGNKAKIMPTFESIKDVCKRTAAEIKKKGLKSVYKNKYSIEILISTGERKDYKILKSAYIDANLNDKERQAWSNAMYERLKESGFKILDSYIGGNDGRAVYRKLIVYPITYKRNKGATLSLTFIDVNRIP